MYKHIAVVQETFNAVCVVTCVEIIPISATRGVGLAELVDLLLSHCEQGPRHYMSSTLTDKSERFCCAEKIRETVFTQFQVSR